MSGAHEHAAREVGRAWFALDGHAQASLRRGWPRLAAALDRLTAGEDGGVSDMLTPAQLTEITDRYRVSPWDAPPPYYTSESPRESV